MGANVKHLDYSGWNSEQLGRLEVERAYRAQAKAKAAHPFMLALNALSDEEKAVGEAPRIRVIARDYGNGLKTCTVARVVPDLERSVERAVNRDLAYMTPRGEGDRDANIERAARRAKKTVGELCRAMAVNSLWTLTYREDQTDRDLALRHFDAFRRAVVKVLGDWRYVAVLETQDRGTWHVHLATHELPGRIEVNGVKLKSWDLMRSIWRGVVGALGGNFDEAKRKPRWGKGERAFKSCGAIASYIAGYVAKDMLKTELNRKRYSASKGIDVPPAYRCTYEGDTPMHELIELAFASVGDRITRAWWDSSREIFVVESDDTGQGCAGRLGG